MTQEEKAKAYDKALKQIKECTPDENGFVTIYPQELFPELKESEDEKIRKDLIEWFEEFPDKIWRGNYKRGHYKKDIISWLEKQKEFVSVDFDDVWKTADCDEVTAPLEKYTKDAIKEMCHAWYDKGIELERKNCLEKQCEQKPADKVEPKFKVNDWVVTCANDVVQIKAVNNEHYTIGNGMKFNMPYVDRFWHKWTIHDAKDGEVLYECNEKKPFIFKELETKHIGDIASYCDIFNGIFNPNEDDWTTLDIVPATKEQRDLLFQKMHEAGYGWDDNKKELKKIEQKTIDKVRPKFKVGDWIIENGNNRNPLQITSFEEDKGVGIKVWFSNGIGTYIDFLKGYHKWTIQDAKKGDVLSDGTTIFIFKDLLSDGSVMSYCDYDTDSGESDAFCPSPVNLICSKITPATKEQRDLLFKKMKEEGYEWDANKKELEKIDIVR